MDIIRTGHPLHIPRNKSYVTDGPVEFSRPPLVDPSRPAEGWTATRIGLLVVLLAMIVGVACLFIADTIPSFLLQSMDFWFEADTIREVSNMIP